ncbi:MAG: serine/threonine protein kinase [Anaerolineae bacterium]|nr:serine/threonine protein kinase [Anaerolineae bacterium]
MAQASLEGTTLGRYRVLEPLGRGGMARVYRAYHPHLDRYVALKLLRSDLVEDKEFLARFHREARAVAALRHPHIVQVFDFDTQDDAVYMVMEYLEGDTLKARLDHYRVHGERMPLGEVGRVMLDALDGLDYAHGEGMIHRDLKPANVLLTKRGQAVLGDFGIAHMVSGTQYTATGALMGTPEYMAPEQGLQGCCDARSDIYAMGVILYEMLTQRVPFEAETPLATLMKHVHEPLPLPRSVNPQIPVALERVVLKALAKDPDHRYATAAEMATALRAALAASAIELPERISRPPSFTTLGAPSEPVQVVSGRARQALKDTATAEAQTDITLGEQVAAARSGVRPHRGKGRRAKAQGRARPSVTQAGTASSRPDASKGIFLAIAVVALGNLLAVTLSSVLGNWAVFRIGWPMELLLSGGALFFLMATTQTIWLSIPAGLATANGGLFAYCALTGNWHHWTFLWIVEPWVAAATVIVSVQLAQKPAEARTISRLFGWAGGVTSILAAVAVQGGSLVLDVARQILVR